VLSALAEAYGRGDVAAVQTAVRQSSNVLKTIRDLRDAPSFFASRPRQDAAFVLEVAVAALRRSDPGLHDEVLKLLEHYGALVRQPFGADAFECAWYWAEIAGLEGAIQPLGAQVFVDRALARCPDLSSLKLASAFLVDQEWPLGTTTPMPGGIVRKVDPARVQSVRSRYEAAMTSPDTALEARVRAAWFEYRIGNLDEASRYLDGAAGLTADRPILYLQALMRGHVLRAQHKPGQAIEAFRAALAVWPGAQSARVALMTLLLAEGDRAQAEALAEQVQAARDGQFDPWWLYWEGDYWAFPAIIGKVRELAR
jgi:tetratricopeptide (TPR) repeat protein